MIFVRKKLSKVRESYVDKIIRSCGKIKGLVAVLAFFFYVAPERMRCVTRRSDG